MDIERISWSNPARKIALAKIDPAYSGKSTSRESFAGDPSQCGNAEQAAEYLLYAGRQVNPFSLYCKRCKDGVIGMRSAE